MDIKNKAEEIVSKIKNDKNIKTKFEKDPVKTIESILGVDLPDEIMEKIVKTVKVKLTADTVNDVAGKLGGLFGKK